MSECWPDSNSDIRNSILQPSSVWSMFANCVGIILAGGLNTRMGGRNKALLRLGDRYFLDYIVRALNGCIDNLLLATREPEVYEQWGIETVKDIFAVRSPLAGIHAGLVHMQAEYAFCTSCDAPLLQSEVVRVLVESIHPGFDVIVPALGTYYQPLCAVYSKRCIPFIEELLTGGDMKTDHLFDRVSVRKVPYRKIRAVDPNLHSFFNVNTPEDLEAAARFQIRLQAEGTPQEIPPSKNGEKRSHPV